jgi:hypothetical protein
VIVLLAVVFAGVAYLAIRMSNNGSGSVANKDYIPAPVEKPEPITVPKHEPVPSGNPVTVAPPVSVKDSLHFVLRATQPVWVSIAPDGIPAYRGELKTGEVRSFRAAEKIVVNIGNQKSVAMTFDGAPLSALPAIQNSSVVVRDLVLTRDHVELGGNYIDLRKPPGAASLPTPTVPIPVRTSIPTTIKKATPTSIKKAASTAIKKAAPASIKKVAPASIKKVAPASIKKVAPATSSHKPASNSKSKATQSKPTKSKKAPKKTSPPPPLIHSVEPIPPRP